MYDGIMLWGLTVDDGALSWKTLQPVDTVNNFTDFSTGLPARNATGAPVIHRVPRSMKERME